MKCLKCGAEYEDGFNTCADCHVPLVPDNYKEAEHPVKEILEKPEEAYQQHAPVLVPFIKHLESMGFMIGGEGNSITATHPKFEALTLTEYEAGIIFEIWFKPTPYTETNRIDYLEFVNKFNNDVPVLRASARNEEKAFVVDAWIPGNYEKERFDMFMKEIVQEVTGVLFRDNEYSKFLIPWQKSE